MKCNKVQPSISPQHVGRGLPGTLKSHPIDKVPYLTCSVFSKSHLRTRMLLVILLKKHMEILVLVDK